jgi:hypothetical protein
MGVLVLLQLRSPLGFPCQLVLQLLLARLRLLA